MNLVCNRVLDEFLKIVSTKSSEFYENNPKFTTTLNATVNTVSITNSQEQTVAINDGIFVQNTVAVTVSTEKQV